MSSVGRRSLVGDAFSEQNNQDGAILREKKATKQSRKTVQACDYKRSYNIVL
jgi:hypothetical protein